MKNYEEMSTDVLRRIGEYNLKKQKRQKILKYTLVPLMCLCLVSIIGIGAWQGGLFDKQLPILEVPLGVEEGLGFEGCFAYSISDLTDGNPWNDKMSIASLPVYKNPLANEETRYITNENRKKLTAYLLEVGKMFNLSADEIVISEDGDSPAMALIGKANGLTISVTAGMTARVAFDSAVALSHPLCSVSTYDEMEKTAAELRGMYADSLFTKQPKVNISGGDYDVDGKEQRYSLSLYEGGGSDKESILKFNLSPVLFGGDEEGRLETVSVNRADETQKVGDYPIISAAEAKQRLLDGKYITTVTKEVDITESNIGKVELVYRRELSDSYIMPYYRYYVYLSQSKDNLRTYGIYYVSAISGEYLSNIS